MTTAQLIVYLTAFISLLIDLPLAFLVLKKDPQSPKHRTLFLYLIFTNIFFQIVSSLVTWAGGNLALSQFFYRWGSLSALTLPLYYFFARAYLGITRERTYLFVFGVYMFLMVITITFVPRLFFTTVWNQTVGYFTIQPSLFTYLISLIGFYLWGVGIAHFYQALKKEKVPIERNRLRYLVVSPLLTIAGMLLVTVPATHFLPFDMLGIMLTSILLSYAVLKHELLDIKLIILESLVYSVFVSLIMSIFVILGFATTLLTGGAAFFALTPSTILSVFLTALILYYLYLNQQKVARLLEEERRIKNQNEEIFAIASHSLRTPITAILGYLEILKGSQEQLTPELQNLVDHLWQSSQKLHLLTEEFLTLSRLEDKNRPLLKEVFSLKDLVGEVCLSYQPLTRQKNLVLKMDLSHEIKVAGDRLMMRLALDNLLDNALRFTEQGEIGLSLTTEEGWAKIAVWDTGVGIPNDQIGGLFQKFFQVGGFRQQEGGVGLGLYIVKKIIEAHQGEVGVESKLGQGSRFWFKLKVV